MKYFIDTEFHEYKKSGIDTIELLSIGIFAENGDTYYAVSSEYDVAAAWNNVWLRQNVLKSIMMVTDVTPLSQIRQEIIQFIGTNQPEFYGYYADYDWVVFCWLFGRMIDLPDGWPMYCRDLKQMMDERCETTAALKARPDYPESKEEHHALADAEWNERLYQFLMRLRHE